MENQQNFSYDLELGTIEEGNEDEPLRESVGDNEDVSCIKLLVSLKIMSSAY